MRVEAVVSRALFAVALAAGCATAPPPPPVEVVRIGAGCRSLSVEPPGAGFVVLGSVSADVPIDADQHVIDERLSGAACSLGADALVRDGAEPLIPGQSVVERVGPPGSLSAQQPSLALPSLAVREVRVFARAIRFLR
jgi:hypothetical protein